MNHAGRDGEHSCMENFHGDDIYPHNIKKHSFAYQILPEHQVSKSCGCLTRRHIKSYQHMEGLNVFSDYVNTTLNIASWKLTGEETLTPTTHQVDACSWKLTGEKISESTTYMNVCPVKVIGELMKPNKMNTEPLEFIGDIMTPD